MTSAEPNNELAVGHDSVCIYLQSILMWLDWVDGAEGGQSGCQEKSWQPLFIGRRGWRGKMAQGADFQQTPLTFKADADSWQELLNDGPK